MKDGTQNVCTAVMLGSNYYIGLKMSLSKKLNKKVMSKPYMEMWTDNFRTFFFLQLLSVTCQSMCENDNTAFAVSFCQTDNVYFVAFF